MRMRKLTVIFLAAMVLFNIVGMTSCSTEPADTSEPSSAETSSTGATSTSTTDLTTSSTEASTTAQENTTTQTTAKQTTSAVTTTAATTTRSTTVTTNAPTTTTTENTDTTYRGVENTDFKKLAPLAQKNVGNTSRFTKLFQKAARGEKIIIGAIGGSITWGAEKTLEGQYIERIGKWFRDTFKCEVEVVNAGIGATNSYFGVHRLQKDLLDYKPDFVIVEYAVNDPDTQLAENSYEMLVRNVLSSETNPAVLLLCTMAAGGKNVQDYHVACGEYYGLPVVSYRDAVWPEMKYGRIKWEELSPDDVHPNNTGHGILSLFVTELLQKIYKKQVPMDESAYTLPVKSYYETLYNEKPIAFKNARIVSASELQVLTTGYAQMENFNGYTVWHLRKGGQVKIALAGVKTVALRYVLWNNGKMGFGSIALNSEQDKIVDAHFANYLPNNGTFDVLPLSYDLDAKKNNVITVSYLDLDGFYPTGTTGESFMFVDLLVSD